MNTALKVLLIGGGAYVLWNLFSGGGSSLPGITSTSSSASQSTAQPTLVATRDLVASAAAKAGEPALLNFWQWNFYYTQIRGIPGPDPFKTYTRLSTLGANYKMSVDEWWNAMKSAGFSGVGGWN